MWRTDPEPVGRIDFAPNPYCYRCPLKKRYPECDLACAEAVEPLLKKEPKAALIAETIQGNAGIVVPPAGYFSRLKEILAAHGALLIIDEVQTGFARSGKMFAIEHFGVAPEIMTMAKALGNGVPISAFIAPAKIADVYTQPGASTLGGNPVSSATALAVLDYIAEEHLAEKAAARGAQLMNGLRRLAETHQCIGDVRGLGLMVGAELIQPDGSPNAALVDFALEELKNRGIIVGKNGIGRNVLAFQPPLVISEDDINHLLNELDSVLASGEKSHGKN